MMKEEKIVQKWRLIKLSKTRPLLASRLVAVLSEKFGDEVYKVAYDYGFEKGEEVARNLRIDGFGEIARFLSMISGVKVEEREEEVLFFPCPVNALEQIKSEKICKGFLEGFFRAFGILVEALPDCKEQCKISVRKTHS
ncbi:MAG: hypothetical protein PWQ22_875 [Archaeoglobaceae archaeon]|nr:hypothetical protein [Archaeoglobaceae archaeon]MDK2876465.1 hypothetical protein [Archaeoglobaceae archaeon]